MGKDEIVDDGYGSGAREAEMRCAVCAQECQYHYYNVRSCEGCKQFFRRCIVMQKEFKCKRVGSCAVNKGEKCQSCRLDRCLKAGMDPKLLENGSCGRQQFVAKLDRRGRAITAKKQHIDEEEEKQEQKHMRTSELLGPGQSVAAGESMLDARDNLLVDLERRQRRIWVSRTELPFAYLEQFRSLEELIQDGRNVLSIAHTFSEEFPAPWDKAKVLERVDQFGLAIDEAIKVMALDRFLVIEMAKAQPIFRKLTLNDQLMLLQHIAIPLGIFFNAYYSAALGSDTWIRADGMMSMVMMMHANRFRGDKRAIHLSKKQFCDSVAAVKRVGLEGDEFAHLLGLFYCSPNASGLSASAQELLYDGSVRHAKLILRYLQLRHGEVAGASRFAERIRLVEMMFNLENNYHLLSLYLDLFFVKKAFDKCISFPTFPKALCSATISLK